MRILPVAIIASALAATGACAYGLAGSHGDSQHELAEALAGYTPEKTVQCIDPKAVDGPQIIDNTTLLYRRGAKILRAHVIGPCPSLRTGVTVITIIRSGQLCRNDQFRTIAPGETIPSAYCRLGDFTQYTKVK